jgi:hypothetical protein
VSLRRGSSGELWITFGQAGEQERRIKRRGEVVRMVVLDVRDSA